MANVGSVDRILRALVGIVLLLLPFIPATATALAGLGGWIWALPAVGAVLLLTAIFRFCPAYRLLGIRTCATK
jgi:membrane protein YdbS with pleckstrin-like domain